MQLYLRIFQYLQEAWLSVFLGTQNMLSGELKACKKTPDLKNPHRQKPQKLNTKDCQTVSHVTLRIMMQTVSLNYFKHLHEGATEWDSRSLRSCAPADSHTQMMERRHIEVKV